MYLVMERIDGASVKERAHCYGERRWAMGGLNWYGAFPDLLLDPLTNQQVADYVRDRIRAMVKDPAVAETLVPDAVFGCKRLCVDCGYYDTFNLDHIEINDSPAMLTRCHDASPL